MNDKEIKIVKEHTQGLSDELYQIVLDRLERALQDRPFWLKLLHFLSGNAGWIEDTVREIVRRVREEFGDNSDSGDSENSG